MAEFDLCGKRARKKSSKRRTQNVSPLLGRIYGVLGTPKKF